MNIEIETKDPMAILTLSDLELPDGVSVSSKPVVMRRDISESWQIALFTVSASIPVGVIVGLILKQFGNDKGTTKIRVNRREVEYEHGEIVRAIEETCEIEDK